MGWQDRPYNQDGNSYGVRLGFTPPPPMTLGVLIACFAVYILKSFAGGFLFHYFALASASVSFSQPWRFVTYQYLHDGPLHIFFNLLGIFFFLAPLERLWGGTRAFAFYTAGGVVGGLAFCVLQALTGSSIILVGASGSILAALGAYALLFPETVVYVIVFPLPIRALAMLLALLYTLTVLGSHQFNDACHLAGLAFGFLAPMYGAGLWGKLSRRSTAWRMKRDREFEQAEQQTIDRILAKVSEQGMQSLTASERRALKRATERQRRNDSRYARGWR
jgi:membrane associated rhomboid family serine protease